MKDVVKKIDSATVVKSVSDLNDLQKAFLSVQDVRESSRLLYGRTLTQFFKWVIDSKRDFATMTRQDIIEYKNDLFSEGMSALTVGSYIVAVRKFYEWCESEKLYPNIAKGVKVPRKVQLYKKQHLNEDKCKELLDYFHDISLRDFCIVNLLLRTGLRTIEIVRANIEDITFRNNQRVLKVWGKGHDEKDSIVVLTNKTWKSIEEYLKSRRGAKSSDPLFVSQSNHNSGGRMTTKSVSRICKEGLKTIGLDGREFSAHSLRHTTGVQILKHGGSIMEVQSVLRHRSISTSQIYVESIREEMRLNNPPEMRLEAAF